MQSLRNQFFQTVDFELGRRFDPQQIRRIIDFTKSCRSGRIPDYAPSLPHFEPSEEYVEGLIAKPWHDPADFPWIAQLEANTPIIQEELRQALGIGKDPQDFKADSNVQKVMGTGWSSLRLQRLGIWNDDVCARFPRTLEILASLDIPFAVRGVLFARQTAGTGVAPHSDGRNFILTMHLGLQIPSSGCWMQVGGEKRQWEEGNGLVIDTCFLHSTGNESEEDRYVLIIDFWHHELTVTERQALKLVYEIRNFYEGRGTAPAGMIIASSVPQMAGVGASSSKSQPTFFDSFKNMFQN